MRAAYAAAWRNLRLSKYDVAKLRRDLKTANRVTPILADMVAAAIRAESGFEIARLTRQLARAQRLVSARRAQRHAIYSHIAWWKTIAEDSQKEIETLKAQTPADESETVTNLRRQIKDLEAKNVSLAANADDLNASITGITESGIDMGQQIKDLRATHADLIKERDMWKTQCAAAAASYRTLSAKCPADILPKTTLVEVQRG